jgi:hypothetical protein
VNPAGIAHQPPGKHPVAIGHRRIEGQRIGLRRWQGQRSAAQLGLHGGAREIAIRPRVDLHRGRAQGRALLHALCPRKPQRTRKPRTLAFDYHPPVKARAAQRAATDMRFGHKRRDRSGKPVAQRAGAVGFERQPAIIAVDQPAGVHHLKVIIGQPERFAAGRTEQQLVERPETQLVGMMPAIEPGRISVIPPMRAPRRP